MRVNNFFKIFLSLYFLSIGILSYGSEHIVKRREFNCIDEHSHHEFVVELIEEKNNRRIYIFTPETDFRTTLHGFSFDCFFATDEVCLKIRHFYSSHSKLASAASFGAGALNSKFRSFNFNIKSGKGRFVDSINNEPIHLELKECRMLNK